MRLKYLHGLIPMKIEIIYKFKFASKRFGHKVLDIYIKYIDIFKGVLMVVLPMSLTSWAHSLSLLRGSKTFRGAAAKASPFALIT